MAVENLPGGPIEIVHKTWENATVDLRRVARAVPINPSDPSTCTLVEVLQQRWDIYENGLPAATRFEWRDIPLVTE